MATILIGSVPIHGHVTPLLACARAFVDRGDSVRFITGSRFADKVTATGATHIPLPAEADFDDRLDFDLVFPERVGLKGTKSLAYEVEHIFIRPGRGQYETVVAQHAAEPADVLLVDPTFAGAAFLLSVPPESRPAVVVAGVVPLPLSSRDTAPFGMGLAPSPVFNRVRNRLLAVAAARVMAGAEAYAQHEHNAVFGFDMPGDVLDWHRRADGIAQFCAAEFEYPRSDAPDHLHFVGSLSATGSQAPLPGWWADLDGSRPVVHVTQGTFANIDLTQLIGPTLEALANEDVLVVVATGGRPLDAMPPLPANARAAEFLPYDDLLPKTDVYVTNGGYGGVQYALRYGVPIVVTGGQEDKPEVGARIAWSGVGLRFRSERPSPTALRRKIRKALDDDRYRTAAESMATKLAQAPGMAGLERIVDDLVARPSG